MLSAGQIAQAVEYDFYAIVRDQLRAATDAPTWKSTSDEYDRALLEAWALWTAGEQREALCEEPECYWRSRGGNAHGSGHNHARSTGHKVALLTTHQRVIDADSPEGDDA